MTGLIKEDLLSIIKKKRFIILTALAYIGLIIFMIGEKSEYFNDLTFFFAVNKYIFYVFDPLIGITLIISVYRKKFTKNSILQVEAHNAKRAEGVISRIISGSVILIACYLIMALLVIILGLILGAHINAGQTGLLMLRLAVDCLAGVAVYITALFWLYLFAFPIVPVLVYGIEMLALPACFLGSDAVLSDIFKYLSWFFVKLNTDYIYTNLLFSDLHIIAVFIFLLQVVIPLLFTLLVFKLKKIRPDKVKKKKVKTGEQETDPSSPDIMASTSSKI
ncbi:MAG: hypothetical protein IKE92_04135 [Clostridiales bacterium]|nr:hypothetical protein [Clostridiales bacterium]